jgi:hypothetical protein
VSDWLRAAAATDEAVGRNEEGLWNLDRAVRLPSEDWVPYADRAALLDQAGHAERANADVDAAVRLGAEATVIVRMVECTARRATKPADWARVANLLKTAAKDAPLPLEDLYHLAVACRKAGDGAGYKAACAAIAKRLTPASAPVDFAEALITAKAFALGPGATGDWAVPLSRADRVLARLAERGAADPSRNERDRPLRQLFLHLRGALLYRAGRPEEAAAALRDPAPLHPLDGEYPNRVYLALAEHRLGHADAAKEAAAKARAAKARAKPDTVWGKGEVELLAAELGAALPPPGK